MSSEAANPVRKGAWLQRRFSVGGGRIIRGVSGLNRARGHGCAAVNCSTSRAHIDCQLLSLIRQLFLSNLKKLSFLSTCVSSYLQFAVFGTEVNNGPGQVPARAAGRERKLGSVVRARDAPSGRR